MRQDSKPQRSSKANAGQSAAKTPGGAGRAVNSAPFAARRIELILQQLEALPTLGAVAVRLLDLTSDDTSQARDVIKLIESDPSLSAKVIRLCRCSEGGRALNVTTVERAVMLLGFNAMRSAVLSVQVFEIFDNMDSPSGERRSGETVFDRVMFWQHSLAVAHVCESLAGTSGMCRNIAKPDAFLSGLLHDLGMLALHVLIPNSFDRVCRFAESNAISIDQACRQMIGLDTHTAGRRLAEHWRLPHSLGDVLWLHGQPLDSLPDLPHRPQVALVSLADMLARSVGLAPLGQAPRGEDASELAAKLGFNAEAVQEVVAALPKEISARAESLGIRRPVDPGALLLSTSRANESLGRINAGLREYAELSKKQTETLCAITQFHDSASPRGSVVTVMGKVVSSAGGIFGGGFFAMLYQARVDDPWELVQFTVDGRPMRSQLIAPPPGSTAVSDLADSTQVSMQALGMLPWLCDYLGDSRDLRDVQLLPLRCGWGVNAVLLHDCPVDGREAQEQLEALSRTWAAAIAAAAQHEGAKRLGEQLAESNRVLMDTQDELARSQALAALGEIAAGAAHEMNNPLTVISGRSQLLASTLTEPSSKAMAQQIVEQSHRISDMITALRMFAEPTKPDLKPVDFTRLLDGVVRQVRGRYSSPAPIKVIVEQGLPNVHVDPEQISRAVTELLRNALESERCAEIELRVQIEPVNDRLMIQVTDDGTGLTQHALAHAFDPFFSSKPAGRQPGLGLAQARRLVEAHGGQIVLENGKQRGAVATIRLSDWRGPEVAQRGAA